MASPTERQVAEWLLHLAALAPVPGRDPKVLGEAIRELTPHLVARYSSAEFDSTSREHVARRCKFFPAYAEICDALDCLPSRAPRAALAGPDDQGMTEEDRQWLSFWHKRMDEIDGQTGNWKRGSREAEMENLDSIVRAQAPRVWRLLRPENVLIHDRPTDAQIAYVGRALRMPGGPLAGSAMPEEEKSKPRPAPVSADTLRALRAARGIKVPEMSADEVYGEVVPA